MPNPSKALLALSLSLASHALHATPLVITTTDQKLQPPGNTTLILLDRPATLETELSHNLPGNAEDAQAAMQHRLTPALAAQITQAHQDVVTAWSLGVTKIPAVVVDQKYVVYGEADVQRALELIARHREQEAQP